MLNAIVEVMENKTRKEYKMRYMRSLRRWIIAIITLVAGGAMAANWLWDGGGGDDTSWANVLNWKNDQFYGTNDIPILGDGALATVEPGGGYPQVSGTLRVGQDGTAELRIVGGILEVTNNVFLGYPVNSNSKGILTVSNGEFRVVGGKDLTLAATKNGNSSDGTLNIYGGTISISRALKLTDGSGQNTIGLYGGKLITKNFEPASANTTITIENGLWIIGGNESDDIQGLVDNGLIFADGSKGGADVSGYTFSSGLNASGDLRWGIDDSSGDTVVFAIPEPASLGLFVAAGCVVLWFRRYLKF